MPDSANVPFKWNFTTATTKAGLTYVKAYKMKWIPELRKSKRVMQRHVGRLLPDNRILISEKFSADYPEYSGSDWYWGLEKRPVSRAEYLQDFPEPEAADTSVEEDDVFPDIDVGLTWAAFEYARLSGITDHLQQAFGAEIGEKLLHLAVYKLAGGTAMKDYERWRETVWMPRRIPMSGQEISEVLKSVTREQVTKYYKLRHDRQGQTWAKIFQTHPELKGRPIEYALDNTSISTYSTQNPDAQYGHAKQNPELAQINYTLVCDQRTGDIVFAYLYEGSVTDTVALSDILHAMLSAGFDLKNNVLVTDRGYASLFNVQKEINLELNFVQGVRKVENSIRAQFSKHRDSLCSSGFYDSTQRAYAFSYDEKWQQATSAGNITVPLRVHLFRLPGREDDTMQQVTACADEIIRLKNAGRIVPSDLWDGYRRFVVEAMADGKPLRRIWVRDQTAIDEAVRESGYFVLRTNSFTNPFEALSVYRQRKMVEQDFYQLKNWLNGNRLRVGPQAVQGKLLVNTIGTALRMMMLTTAKSIEQKNPSLKIPENSLDSLLKTIAHIRADKRKNANVWIRRMISAPRRRCLQLLDLPDPPKKLKM